MRSSIPLLVLFAVPALAGADTFDGAVDKSEAVGPKSLGSLMWAQSGVCPDARDKADRLACEEVASRLRERTAGRSFYFRSASGALTAGSYNKAKKSVPVVVEACLICDAVSSGNESLLVVGRLRGGKTVQPLRTTSKVFKTRQDAEMWTKESLPRLVGEYIIRIPSTPERVSWQGKRAAFVDVLSYRIFDPCSGRIAASKPKLRAVAADPEACK